MKNSDINGTGNITINSLPQCPSCQSAHPSNGSVPTSPLSAPLLSTLHTHTAHGTFPLLNPTHRRSTHTAGAITQARIKTNPICL